VKYREDEPGSNVRVRRNDKVNLRTFGDSTCPLNIEERFGFRAIVNDSRIGPIDDDNGVAGPPVGRPNSVRKS